MKYAVQTADHRLCKSLGHSTFNWPIIIREDRDGQIVYERYILYRNKGRRQRGRGRERIKREKIYIYIYIYVLCRRQRARKSEGE